jgi:Zn-dependent peptidase ImmA (M78 family)
LFERILLIRRIAQKSSHQIIHIGRIYLTGSNVGELTVFNAAKLGEGRSRMTLVHELGHALMHDGGPKFRHTGAVGTTDLSKDRPFESAERQAKIFAPAFLIHDEIAATLTHPW